MLMKNSFVESTAIGTEREQIHTQKKICGGGEFRGKECKKRMS